MLDPMQHRPCAPPEPDRRPATLGLTLILTALLGACAPSTRVILLPQDNGKPSAVDVTTGQGTQQLDQPYQVAHVGPMGRISLASTSADQVLSAYPSLLALQPRPPEKFTLTFEAGTPQLTAGSLAQLDTVVARARAHPGGEIVVTGHTDRRGALEANDRLSLERARSVRSLLIERGFRAELVEAVGRGEREPLVPTDDEVMEPRNRRAEVLVR